MKQLSFSILLLALLSACGQKEVATAADGLKTEIATLEAQILASGDASQNEAAALQLVEKTKEFAKANPTDPDRPELLFKAADVANGAQQYGKAVQLWGMVWREHPNHPRAPMALFLQGFTFDSKLRNVEMATQYYQDFLKRYPNDSLSVQVKELLAVVNVPPEQLIKQFEEAQ